MRHSGRPPKLYQVHVQRPQPHEDNLWNHDILYAEGAKGVAPHIQHSVDYTRQLLRHLKLYASRSLVFRKQDGSVFTITEVEVPNAN